MMSDFDSYPADRLDQRLVDQHRKLVVDIADTLDIEAGLGAALIPTHHAELVADLSRCLDIEAGLAAIVPVAPGVRTGPSKAIGPHPVPHRTRFRDRGQTLARTPRRVRGLLIAAAVTVVLAAIAPAMIRNIQPSPPTTTNSALDVLGYGVTARTDVGTVWFTFTIKARGSGTLHYIWQPDDRLSGQPVRAENLTFTGPIQTTNVFYPVPYTCYRGQRVQGGMKVEITKPESTSGASYVPYDFTC